MTGLVLRYEPLAFLRDPLGQKYLGQGFCSSWRAEVSKHILSCLLCLRMTSHHITISMSIYFVSSILSYLFLYCDSCQILFNFNPRSYFSLNCSISPKFVCPLASFGYVFLIYLIAAAACSSRAGELQPRHVSQGTETFLHSPTGIAVQTRNVTCSYQSNLIRAFLFYLLHSFSDCARLTCPVFSKFQVLCFVFVANTTRPQV